VTLGYEEEEERSLIPDPEAAARAQQQALETYLDAEDVGGVEFFSEKLRRSLGYILPHQVVIVGARPGCGKTTWMLQQARHMVFRQGRRVIYIGTETAPHMLKMELAARDCKLSSALVLQRRWELLPPDARERVRARALEYEKSGKELFFSEEPTVKPLDVDRYINYAFLGDYDAVFLDHIHHIDWGTTRADEKRLRIEDAMKRWNGLAKETGVRLFLAAQLTRNDRDVVADYMVPSQSALKDSGAVEEVGHVILLMHRCFVDGTVEADVVAVRRGVKKLHEIAEPNTVGINIAKSRVVGDARDEQIRLYLANGSLFDTREARDRVYGPNWRSIT
jgi:replicative DNA helicase